MYFSKHALAYTSVWGVACVSNAGSVDLCVGLRVSPCVGAYVAVLGSVCT